ncbi:9385_t:CDS:2, partial [Racocetra fulgida]
MKTQDSYQFASYDTTWSNEDELELDGSSDKSDTNILENLHSSDVKLLDESTSILPDQSALSNSGVTITNSLAYCRVEVVKKDGTKSACDHHYELTTGTGNLKSHLHQIHRILPPEANNNNQLAARIWNSTYNLLKNLSFLHNAIEQLSIYLKQSVNRQERQDGIKLLELFLSLEEWISLNELVELLFPFAQVTGYIRENQYPTLGIMIPTLIKLFHHLRDFYLKITSSTIRT